MEEFLDSGVRMALFAGISVSADVLCPGCWSRLEPARGEGRLARPSIGAQSVPVVSPFHTNDELLALVPVPLHPRREKSRGYNQAALLAHEVAGRLELDVDSSILMRIRSTKAQSTLESDARAANVAGAFGLARPDHAAARDIIIVDDLVTTGETALACAAALEVAVPRSISVLAAGRARD